MYIYIAFISYGSVCTTFVPAVAGAAATEEKLELADLSELPRTYAASW